MLSTSHAARPFLKLSATVAYLNEAKRIKVEAKRSYVSVGFISLLCAVTFRETNYLQQKILGTAMYRGKT